VGLVQKILPPFVLADTRSSVSPTWAECRVLLLASALVIEHADIIRTLNTGKKALNLLVNMSGNLPVYQSSFTPP